MLPTQVPLTTKEILMRDIADRAFDMFAERLQPQLTDLQSRLTKIDLAIENLDSKLEEQHDNTSKAFSALQKFLKDMKDLMGSQEEYLHTQLSKSFQGLDDHLSKSNSGLPKNSLKPRDRTSQSPELQASEIVDRLKNCFSNLEASLVCEVGDKHGQLITQVNELALLTQQGQDGQSDLHSTVIKDLATIKESCSILLNELKEAREARQEIGEGPRPHLIHAGACDNSLARELDTNMEALYLTGSLVHEFELRFNPPLLLQKDFCLDQYSRSLHIEMAGIFFLFQLLFLFAFILSFLSLFTDYCLVIQCSTLICIVLSSLSLRFIIVVAGPTLLFNFRRPSLEQLIINPIYWWPYLPLVPLEKQDVLKYAEGSLHSEDCLNSLNYYKLVQTTAEQAIGHAQRTAKEKSSVGLGVIPQFFLSQSLDIYFRHLARQKQRNNAKAAASQEMVTGTSVHPHPNLPASELVSQGSVITYPRTARNANPLYSAPSASPPILAPSTHTEVTPAASTLDAIPAPSSTTPLRHQVRSIVPVINFRSLSRFLANTSGSVVSENGSQTGAARNQDREMGEPQTAGVKRRREPSPELALRRRNNPAEYREQSLLRETWMDLDEYEEWTPGKEVSPSSRTQSYPMIAPSPPSLPPSNSPDVTHDHKHPSNAIVLYRPRTQPTLVTDASVPVINSKAIVLYRPPIHSEHSAPVSAPCTDLIAAGVCGIDPASPRGSAVDNTSSNSADSSMGSAGDQSMEILHAVSPLQTAPERLGCEPDMPHTALQLQRLSPDIVERAPEGRPFAAPLPVGFSELATQSTAPTRSLSAPHLPAGSSINNVDRTPLLPPSCDHALGSRSSERAQESNNDQDSAPVGVRSIALPENAANRCCGCRSCESPQCQPESPQRQPESSKHQPESSKRQPESSKRQPESPHAYYSSDGEDEMDIDELLPAKRAPQPRPLLPRYLTRSITTRSQVETHCAVTEDFTPKSKTLAECNFKRAIREFIEKLYENKKPLQIQTPSHAQLKRFQKSGKDIDGPTLTQLLMDFDGTSSRTPWNQRLCWLLAQSFLEEGQWPDYTTHNTQKAFMTHLVTLHRNYKKRSAPDDIETRIEARRRQTTNNQSQRQRQLRHRRAEAAHYFTAGEPAMQKFDDLWKKMSKDTCSGDEAESDPETHATRYVIKTPKWRNSLVTPWFRAWDALSISFRYGSDGKLLGPGQFPRIRISPSDEIEDRDAKAPPGLPRNFYDDDWYQSLDATGRRKLNAQPRIDLTFSKATIRTIERYQHIRTPKDIPLDINDPTLTPC
ncbi:hypothetical protein NP233_g8866 [Leucocoprinus birnbaumii]|uniref:Uncharacterized protein n=1 Tax=Leucocoprinus birnbaumii TaxID=56174 RepID=A0AAD5VLN4_9AGAR|nr:hypothetical protein NP233_g8866 [Leucocoprinus birnbaumii]